MATIVKHEHHQVDSQFSCVIDEKILSKIYPDLTYSEIKQLLNDVEDGIVLVDTIVEDAYNNDVDLDWNRDYDDWWTDRKGGYDVTYELGTDNLETSSPFYYDD